MYPDGAERHFAYYWTRPLLDVRPTLVIQIGQVSRLDLSERNGHLRRQQGDVWPYLRRRSSTIVQLRMNQQESRRIKRLSVVIDRVTNPATLRGAGATTAHLVPAKPAAWPHLDSALGCALDDRNLSPSREQRMS
jgi:hypothetical protein